MHPLEWNHIHAKLLLDLDFLIAIFYLGTLRQAGNTRLKYRTVTPNIPKACKRIKNLKSSNRSLSYCYIGTPIFWTITVQVSIGCILFMKVQKVSAEPFDHCEVHPNFSTKLLSLYLVLIHWQKYAGELRHPNIKTAIKKNRTVVYFMMQKQIFKL